MNVDDVKNKVVHIRVILKTIIQIQSCSYA